jgi:tetratricopeptide (TPR) repeat protein
VADSPRIDDLRRRLQEDPASLAFAPLAEELRRAGRAQEAVRVCRTGLALHPEYLSARATLGRALLDLGQLDDAFAEFTAVLAAAPEHLSAIRGMAEIERRRGELPAAPRPARETTPAADPEVTRRAEVLAALERFLAAIVVDRQRRHSVSRR